MSGANPVVRPAAANSAGSVAASSTPAEAPATSSGPNSPRSRRRPSDARACPAHQASAVTPTEIAALGCTHTSPATATPTATAERRGSRGSSRTPARTPGVIASAAALARIPPSCIRWNVGRYSPAATSAAIPAASAAVVRDSRS